MLRELEVWLLLEHPNVLPLEGFMWREDSHFPSLVSEWMPHGSLREYLKRSQVSTLAMVGSDIVTFQRQMHMYVISQLAGVTCGLAYLHKMGVVHGDLKAVSA